jgi:hypothetical protein
MTPGFHAKQLHWIIQVPTLTRAVLHVDELPRKWTCYKCEEH